MLLSEQKRIEKPKRVHEAVEKNEFPLAEGGHGYSISELCRKAKLDHCWDDPVVAIKTIN